jgi:protein phosphatase
MTPPKVTLDAAAVTSAGLKRVVNEDSVLASDPVYVVADGMGGHEAGDRASAIVVEEMGQLLGRSDLRVEEVKATLTQARHRIGRIGSRDQRHAAGTTVSGVILVSQNDEPYWLVVNVGDSRTYRLAQAELEQLSIDHSEVQELLDAGRITAAQVRSHPRRNVVTRVLGAGTVEQPDYWLLPVERDERLLVCSDGLTSEVVDADIQRVLLDQPSPAQAANALVSLALASGGRDNISVIVVDVQMAGDADSLGSTADGPRAVANVDDTIPVASRSRGRS